MTKVPTVIKFRGARYVRATLSYDDIGARGAVEVGWAIDSSGKKWPGWADKSGRKYAEVEPAEGSAQTFIRIDNQKGWTWEWEEGTSQEDVDNFPYYM